MWFEAVARQYNLFGTLLIFLISTTAIIGAILGNSELKIVFLDKLIFSSISLVLLISICILLRMVHIEREIAFKADPPKSGDSKLQNEENRLRFGLHVMLVLAIFAVLFLVNLMIWRI